MSKFKFTNNTPSHKKAYTFSCTLKSKRCDAKTRQGQHCKRKLVKGLPYCWYHLKHNSKLVIAPSTIKGAGTGIYACSADEEPVFKKGTIIIPYYGEALSEKQLNARYGSPDDITAPYAVSNGKGKIIDAACERGAASFSNDARTLRNNAVLDSVTLTSKQAAHLNTGRFMNKLRAGQKVICIIAKRDIKNGQEIFLDYGDDYWEDMYSKHSTSGTKPKRQCFSK